MMSMRRERYLNDHEIIYASHRPAARYAPREHLLPEFCAAGAARRERG